MQQCLAHFENKICIALVFDLNSHQSMTSAIHLEVLFCTSPIQFANRQMDLKFPWHKNIQSLDVLLGQLRWVA